MSSGYWQIERQRQQFSSGKTPTEKVKGYVQVWKDRCYENDIPDEVPLSLMKTGRVPSYKAIAIAILKNDLTFSSLGFTQPKSKLADQLYRENKKRKETQLELF